MWWILLPIGSAILYTLSAFTDNYLTDVHFKKRDPAPLVLFGAISAIICIGVMVAWRGLDIFGGAGMAAFGLLAAGVIHIVVQLPYYQALKTEDTTGATVLMQAYPVLALVLGVLVLGERISVLQGLAFVLVLVAAMILIAGTRTKRGFKLGIKTGGLIGLACLGWAVGDVIFVVFGRGVEYYEDAYVWFLLGVLGTIVLLGLVRRDWMRVVREFLVEQRSHKMRVVLMNEMFDSMAEMLFRAALLAAPIALVTVTSQSAQMVLTFGLGIGLTLLIPRFGREKLKRRQILIHLIATVLVVVGIVMMKL
ncbi:EamA family transporter [Candidatus Saccharibacteria bacterium]|nr:EamA family transporter [Candidatus Saccharibacteria bacterium]